MWSFICTPFYIFTLSTWQGAYQNRGSVFFDSEKGNDGTGNWGYVKLHPDESYSDTVYFIIDKVTEDNCNLVIKVAPFGDNHQTVAGKSVTTYNNGYGFIKVNYSDIIWEWGSYNDSGCNMWWICVDWFHFSTKRG